MIKITSIHYSRLTESYHIIWQMFPFDNLVCSEEQAIIIGNEHAKYLIAQPDWVVTTRKNGISWNPIEEVREAQNGQ